MTDYEHRDFHELVMVWKDKVECDPVLKELEGRVCGGLRDHILQATHDFFDEALSEEEEE